MKVRFICDCCDLVFAETEVPEGETLVNGPALTGEGRHDIIFKNQQGSDLYISGTCEECNQALGLEGDHFLFYREPLIH